MKTIVLDRPGHFSMADSATPEGLGPGEALVRVHRVGVCGTDLHAFRGDQPFFTYPRVLGHELGVEVVALAPGAAGELVVGDRCAVEPYLNCGRCVACRRGKGNCCEDLRVLGVHTDGGLRECLVVPVAKLHRSATLSLDQLATVEMLGIGAHAVERARLEAGEWALVIGAGPIGLGTIQFAQVAGARIIALDLDPHRLAFCRQRLGVKFTVEAGERAPDEVRAITGGDLPTAVFDATGSARSMMGAFDWVAHGGRLVFVGLFQGDVSFHDPDFHRRELTLFASRNATAADFGRVIGLLESGRIDTMPWITHRAPFDEMIARFPSWLQPESRTIKAMVTL